MDSLDTIKEFYVIEDLKVLQHKILSISDGKVVNRFERDTLTYHKTYGDKELQNLIENDPNFFITEFEAMLVIEKRAKAAIAKAESVLRKAKLYCDKFIQKK